MLRASTLLAWLACVYSAEHWEQDVTESMKIGATLNGYSSVTLLCAADHLQLQVQLDEEFNGVLYARGAFHSREEPCFLDAAGGRNFTLRVPFHQCNTRHDDGMYSNTIVVQHDDELVMPGDAAFKVECDFKHPKEYTVSANLPPHRDQVLSRITLADADPAAKDLPKNLQITVYEESDRVTFNPRSLEQPIKDEL